LCLDLFQDPLHFGAKSIEYILIKDTQIDIQSFLSFHMGSAERNVILHWPLIRGMSFCVGSVYGESHNN
jgi:hypothetical protein